MIVLIFKINPVTRNVTNNAVKKKKKKKKKKVKMMVGMPQVDKNILLSINKPTRKNCTRAILFVHHIKNKSSFIQTSSLLLYIK